MKVYSFFIAVASSIIFLILLAIGAGPAVAIDPQANIDNQRVELPNAAKFFPKRASLTIHWMPVDAVETDSIDWNTPSNKTNNIHTSQKLREGLFALTGLDFDTEIASWVDPEISLAFFESNEVDQPLDWIIAFSKINKNGAKNFLQSYWQKEVLAGKSLNIENYRGVGLISGQKILSEDISKTSATALIGEDLLLIASEKKILRNSLDISQQDDLNQLGDQELKKSIKHLDDGIALITISPTALQSFFSLPLEVSQRKDLEGFATTLQVNKKNITLNGILQFKNMFEGIDNQQEKSLSLSTSTTGPAESLAIIYSPYELLDTNNKEPLSQIIGPLIRNELKKTKGFAATTITSLNKGPLIWIKEPKGWILGTKEGEPPFEVIDDVLKKQGQLQSELFVNKKIFTVWSKLVTKNDQEKYTLETDLGAILYKESDNNWWGETLEAIQQREEYGLEPRKKQLEELTKNKKRIPIVQLALDENQAQTYLTHWYPWLLLQTISGNHLTNIIKGLALTIDHDKTAYESGLELRVNIEIA